MHKKIVFDKQKSSSDLETQSSSAVVAGLLRSKYDPDEVFRGSALRFYVSNVRKFVSRIDGMLTLEDSYAQEIAAFASRKGDLLVKTEPDPSYTPQDWATPHTNICWSDFQIQVYDNMQDKLTRLRQEIQMFVFRLKKFL